MGGIITQRRYFFKVVLLYTELRAYYERLFTSYPDVVTLPVFIEMMGGISESFARRLLQRNIVRSQSPCQKA